MRKTFPLLLAAVAAALSAHAAAQSGRRIATPLPTTERPAAVIRAEESTEARTAPPMEVASGYVPESVLSREFQSLREGRFRLSDFSGKVLVLNLWASWCGPCRREVPELEEVRREYESKGVEFIGLTTENPQADEARVKQFVRDSKMGYRVGWIDRESARALMRGHNTIPQTFVIAGDGQIVQHLRGYAQGRTADMLRDSIDRALSK
jgi:thiol-disulfide isomerase/thioredoxin